jgi:hypothetical protein
MKGGDPSEFESIDEEDRLLRVLRRALFGGHLRAAAVTTAAASFFPSAARLARTP